MEQKELEKIVQRWHDMTGKVIAFEEILEREIQKLLLDTYEVFYSFHKEEMIPREIIPIIQAMDSFVDFLVMYEEDDDESTAIYNFHKIFPIINALQQGFLIQKYDVEFPKIKICDLQGKESIIDLENDQLFV